MKTAVWGHGNLDLTNFGIAFEHFVTKMFRAADIDVDMANRITHQYVQQHLGLDYRFLSAYRIAWLFVHVTLIVMNE